MKTKLFYTAFIILVSLITAQAQWIQNGYTIYGEHNDDKSGKSISMSADGSIIAIGSPYNADNGEDAGQVRVYKNLAGSWTQMGNDIEGDPIWGYSGWSVSLSDDGLTLAIGAPEAYDENLYYAGQVKIFHYDGAVWQQIGDPIIGETTSDDRAGNAVSLSADGSILAVASYGIDHYKGRVRVFENIAGVWTQIGNSMDGLEIGEEFGYSIDLNADGTILVVSVPKLANSNVIGYLKVFKNIAGVWQQEGNTINGDEIDDRFGWSVSINDTGNRIAVSAPFHGSFDGIVQVYDNNAGVWEQVGDNIIDVINDYMFGSSVSLNGTGDKIVIGASRTGSNTGHVEVFKFVSGIWEQIGENILGETYQDYFGTSVAISSDGNIVTMGAPGNDTNGDNSGQVKVYQYTDTSGIENLTVDSVTLFPNPVESSFTISFLDKRINKISITDSTGKVIVKTSNLNQDNTIDISGLDKGVYFVKIQIENKTIIKKIIKK